MKNGLDLYFTERSDGKLVLSLTVFTHEALETGQPHKCFVDNFRLPGGPGETALSACLVSFCATGNSAYSAEPAETIHEALKREDSRFESRARAAYNIFGQDPRGRPVCRYVLSGSTRGDSTVVELLPGGLRPTDIRVFVNEQRIHRRNTERLLGIVAGLEAQWDPRGRLKPTMDRAVRLDLMGRTTDAMLTARRLRSRLSFDDGNEYVEASIGLAMFLSNAGLQDASLDVLDKIRKRLRGPSGFCKALGPRDGARQYRRMLYHLGISNVRKKRFAVARRFLGRLQTFGAAELKVGVLHQLGVIEREVGHLDESIAIFRECVKIRQRRKGYDGYRVAFDMRSLARVYAMRSQRGDLRRAKEWFDKAQGVLKRHGIHRYLHQIERDRAAYLDIE